MASGYKRSIDKAIAKADAGDTTGAVKLLNSLKTTVQRSTPQKVPTTASAEIVARIDEVIAELNA